MYAVFAVSLDWHKGTPRALSKTVERAFRAAVCRYLAGNDGNTWMLPQTLDPITAISSGQRATTCKLGASRQCRAPFCASLGAKMSRAQGLKMSLWPVPLAERFMYVKQGLYFCYW